MEDIYQNTLSRLASLDAYLRVNGFETSPERWINVHDLLLKVAVAGRNPTNIDELRALIAPLLCTSKEQQDEFNRIFKAWSAARPQEPSALNTEIAAEPIEAASLHRYQRNRQQWPYWLVGVFLFTVVTALAFYFGGGMQYINHLLTPVEEETASGSKIASDTFRKRQTATSLQGIKRAAEEIPIQPVPPRKPLPPILPPTPFRIATLAIAGAFIGLPMIVYLTWLVLRYRRKQLVLRQMGTKAQEPAASLALKGGNRRPFWGGALPRVLHRLRRGKAIEVRRLDENRTVEHTVRNAGLFEPVRAQRPWRPEYVFLIDHAPGNEYAVGIALALVERFKAEGLATAAYYYFSNPNVCTALDSNHHISIKKLAARHANARLLVVGNAETFYHPLTAEPMPVLETLRDWPSCACLTHRAAPWGYFEMRFAQDGFSIAPLSGQGVAAISRLYEHPPRQAPWFEPPISGEYPACLQHDAERWLRPEAPDDATDMLSELESYLGLYPFRLFTAMAAYPKIHPPLTLALDQQLRPKDSAHVREQRLLRLSQLPWCRYGYMPRWLRERLLHNSTEEQQNIRDAYLAVFARQAGASSASFELPIWLEENRSFVDMIKDSVRFARRDSSAADAIFAKLILGGQQNLLDFELPAWIRQRLPQLSLSLSSELVAFVFSMLVMLGLYASWHYWVGPYTDSKIDSLVSAVNKSFNVEITHLKSTEPLALRLESALKERGFTVTVRENSDSGGKVQSSATNTVAFGSWWTRLGAAQVVEFLYLLTYRDANLISTAANNFPLSANQRQELGVRKIHVSLQQVPSGGPAVVFRDTLVYEQVSAGEAILAEMTLIPAGKFNMGSPPTEEGRTDAEGPIREVRVAAFEMAKTELTVGEFKRFVEETAYVTSAERGDGCFSYDETRNEFDFIKGSSWSSLGFAQTDLSPVVCVSQVDALAYIEWLNRRTGATYRLPTEAEWEYAARGGSTTTRYWGDEADAACDHANVADESAGRQLEGLERHACDDGVVYTAQVGRYIPNANGLYDMLGNVWEWTADCWHEDYTEAPQDGRAWRESNDGDCDNAVVRGGAWSSGPRGARSAGHFRDNSVEAYSDVGFRLARTL